ncbi:hypothetical protein DN752_11370 [Echinicola strongylocentroti]|uniref:T9SS C-terminal target domain-containing protein n=2 Tax=Echinicola strongylocentroti TaxID=1795355 RepID=A0A2Z4IJH6_9BACT|nr:hypothetical protein DN752_11370 [Echinicola strongylocentroti]
MWKNGHKMLFIFCTIGISHAGFAQQFESNSDGDWSASSTWDSTNPNGCATPTQSPDNSSPCRTNVIVNHSVEYQGDANIGRNTFSQITVSGALANLIFTGDVTLYDNNGGVPPTVFNVENGASLNIQNGTLNIGAGAVMNIIGNSTVIVENLSMANNTSTINIEEGSRLIVLNESIINSSSTLNVNGDFSTKGLSFSSGGVINSNENGVVNVEQDVNMNSGQLNMEGRSEMQVGGSIVMGGGARIDMSDDTFVHTEGDVNVNSWNTAALSGNASFLVDGSTNGGNHFSAIENACYRSQNQNMGSECARTLPVVFNEINGILASYQTVKVLWSVYEDNFVSTYSIERSFNGISNFKTVGEVSGGGWTNELQHYTFDDDDLPVQAGRLYYRIKQVDTDGKATFSKIIGLDIQGLSTGKAAWQIYPNPSKGEQIHLALTNPEKYHGEEMSITIFNSLNQSRSFQASSVEELNMRLREELAQFSKGLVVVKVRWADESQLIKLLL